jgi:Domain of unknown function (DUF5666)
MQDPGLTKDSLAKEDPEESATEVYDAVDVVDDYDYDTDEPHRTWPKITLALFVGVLMAVAFTGGVLAQKRNDTGLTSAATSLPAGFPGGFPGGGAAGGTGPAAGGTGTTTGATTTSPVLVGTVVAVSGAATTFTVKDLGGTNHTVTTTGTTTVIKQEQKKVTNLAAGDTVSINGKRATNGSVAATAFTIR